MDWYLDFILNDPSIQDALRNAKQTADFLGVFEDDINYAKQTSRDLQSMDFDKFGLPAFVPNLRSKAKNQSIVVPEKPKLLVPSGPDELTLAKVQARLKDPNLKPKRRKNLLNQEVKILLKNPDLSNELRQSLLKHLRWLNRRPPTNAKERRKLELAFGYAHADSKKKYAEYVGYTPNYLSILVVEWRERGML